MADGTPGPLRDAHEAAQAVVEGSMEHLPDAVREELEAHGIEADDLEPSLGGIRGGLWREDVPRVVAAVLEHVDGAVEIEVRPADGHHYEVEWHRAREDDWGSWGEFRTASEGAGER